MLSISAPALLLSLACGIGFSASDYFRKAVPKTCSSILLMVYFTAGQMPVLAAYLAWSGGAHLTPGYWVPGLIDAGLGLAANLMFIAAVRQSQLSLMVPVLALVPAMTAAVGSVMLNEKLTSRQLVGTVLVVAGLLLLFLPHGKFRGIVAALKDLRRERGLPWMLGTALCWSVTPSLDKIATAESSVPLHGLIQLLAMLLAAAGWVVAHDGLRGLKIPAGAGRPLAAGSLAAGFGYLFQLAGYVATMVAVVELIKRVTGILGALVMGRVMFKEPISPLKVAGIVVICAGLPQVILT